MEDVYTTNQFSSKSRLLALILGIFLGGVGVHNFYLGKILRGISKILLHFAGMIVFMTGYFEKSIYANIISYAGVFMILLPVLWAIFEWVFIAFGKAKDSRGLPVYNWYSIS